MEAFLIRKPGRVPATIAQIFVIGGPEKYFQLRMIV